MQANMGMAGEFRVVVKRADGSVKTDTGYQKNLILNQGLDFFGGGNGSNMMAYCVIGSGNSTPNYTQNKLDTAVLGVSGTTSSTKYDYNAATDGNLYKTNKVRKYSFTGLNNVNVSELGLASTYSNATTYYLCTRALIKDSQGNPTTITVLSGEILEIYYKLWSVYDTTDKTSQINVLDAVGGSVPYNYIVRLANVGTIDSLTNSPMADWTGLSADFDFSYHNYILSLSNNNLGSINSVPSGGTDIATSNGCSISQSVYKNGDYKKILTVTFETSTGNDKAIRSLYLRTKMGFWQIRFGSVADDSPITKTSTQTLTIPVEFSWGRYEGAL